MRVPNWVKWKFRTLQSRPSGAEARTVSPMPSREASVEHFEVSSNGDVQDPEPIDLRQEQVREAVRNLLQPMWNPASITDMEVVVLDHITAILYVGR